MTRQEELDTRIRLAYALPAYIKKSFQDSKFKSLNKIAATNPEDIIKRAQKVMQYWSPEKMNEYMGTDIYSLELSGAPDFQLEWARFVTDDYEDIEIVLQVYRLFKRIGVEISLLQAEFVWSYLSDVVCAQWLCKSDDESVWSDILTDFLYNQPKEVEEELTKGD